MPTVPIYRFNAADPGPAPALYKYSLDPTPPTGWKPDRVSFYAFSDDSTEGTVPIYEHTAKDGMGRVRYMYDSTAGAHNGWSAGRVVFYAYPANPTIQGTTPIYGYYNTPYGDDRWNCALSPNPNISSGWIEDKVMFRAPQVIDVTVSVTRDLQSGTWLTVFNPAEVTIPYPAVLNFIRGNDGWKFKPNPPDRTGGFQIVSASNPDGRADFTPQPSELGETLTVVDNDNDPGEYSYCLTLVDSASGVEFSADPEVANVSPDSL